MKSISGKRHFSGRGKKALLTGAFLVSSCAAPTVASSSSSSEEKTSEEEILTSYPMVEGVETTEGLSYEIFVASFADSNGDGIGDFKGIEEKADYIASLGVNQVWLMPIHPPLATMAMTSMTIMASIPNTGRWMTSSRW